MTPLQLAAIRATAADGGGTGGNATLAPDNYAGGRDPAGLVDLIVPLLAFGFFSSFTCAAAAAANPHPSPTNRRVCAFSACAIFRQRDCRELRTDCANECCSGGLGLEEGNGGGGGCVGGCRLKPRSADPAAAVAGRQGGAAEVRRWWSGCWAGVCARGRSMRHLGLTRYAAGGDADGGAHRE